MGGSESRSVVSNSLQPHGLYSPWNSPVQNTGVSSFPFSRGSSQPRDQTQASHTAGDSWPAEPQRKTKNTGVGSLSLLQWICLTQESNQGLLHCMWILYQLSSQGSLSQRNWVKHCMEHRGWERKGTTWSSLLKNHNSAAVYRTHWKELRGICRGNFFSFIEA